MEHPFSAERLNAYIDNQLDAEEAELVLKALQESSPLSQEVCELHKVQDMVRHAYSVAPLPQSTHANKAHRPRYLQGVAALLLLAVGASLGWLAHDANPSMESVYLSSAPQRTQNVILHISTDDPVKVSDALDQAQLLLERNKKLGHPFRLEIVANGEGLNLLRARYSNFPERTEELIQDYDNLTVMACSKALQAIRAKGGDTQLLPNVNTTDSALDRVVTRLQEGWLYIKV
jgi:intracellular sulfur oxidation DsrE/DsrF family protein